MKTKTSVPKPAISLASFVIVFLFSCQKGEWCIDCQCECDIPVFGSRNRTFCAESPDEVEAEVSNWMDNRIFPDCWSCSLPYEK